MSSSEIRFRLSPLKDDEVDRIDPLAGVTLDVQVGDKVVTGSPLATLEKSGGPDGLESAAAELLKAFTISTSAEAIESLIFERIV